MGLSSEELSLRAKRTMARTGKLGRNYLWTQTEIDILRAYWPDVSQIMKKLPRRSQKAIIWKARLVGMRMATRRQPWHPWTAEDRSRLRKLYPHKTKQELLEIFSGRSWKAIQAQAQIRKTYRPKFEPTWQKTGRPILDGIRERAREFNFSQRDVLAMARISRRRRDIFHARGSARFREIDVIVRALGGRIVIQWID